MIRYDFLNSKKGHCIFAVFLFITLLFARDTLPASIILNIPASQIFVYSLFLLMGLAFLFHNRNQIPNLLRDKRITLVLLLAVVMLLPLLLKQDWQLMYLNVLICIGFAVFLTFFIDPQRVARLFILFMAGLSVYSLIALYLIKPLLENGILPSQIIYNSSDVPFYNMGLAFAWAKEHYYRNFGIFREPGSHQFFLTMCLYLTNYVVTWDSPRKLWICNLIFAVTLLSTFSTNGIIQLVLFAGILFFEKKLYKKKLANILAAVIVTAAAIMLVYIIRQRGELYWTLHHMVTKLFTVTSSSTARYESISYNLSIFFRHPILGSTVVEVLHGIEHNTSSTLILFALFGVGGGLFSVITWFALIWDSRRSVIWNLGLLVVLFMSFNTQNLITDVFFWLFPVMAFVERIYPHLERPGKAISSGEAPADPQE